MSKVIETDQRFTPEHVLDVVRQFGVGEIALDPCTTADNPTKARVFFAWPEHNGLSIPWSEHVCGGTAFVNCPYSRGQIRLWAVKCLHESTADLDVVGLLPGDLGTAGGQVVAQFANAICFVRGRLAFGSPNGQLAQGAKQPSIMPYWGERAGRFRRVFSQLGTVWVR